MQKCKITLLLAGLFLMLNTVAIASFTLPSNVYRADELQTAVNNANDKGIPIVFLYSDENTTCGLCTSASQDVMDEFKDSAIIIYYSSKNDNDWDKMPSIIKRAIVSTQAGKYIPKTIITDSVAKNVRVIVPYVRDRNQRKSILHEANTVFQK
jgi:hypothetical protein